MALVILAVAVIPLMDALSQSFTTGEQAGRESLMVYLAQGKMEQYLQWFRQYGGQGYALRDNLAADGVDLDPSDGPGAVRSFPDYPGYTYRASLSPAWDGSRALRVLQVEVKGPEGRQVVLTTLVW